MTSRDFVYWLQGKFEDNDVKTFNEAQVTSLKNHLKLVFLYDIDPSYTDNEILQHIMQNVHDGKDPMDGVDASLKVKRPRRGNGSVQLKC